MKPACQTCDKDSEYTVYERKLRIGLEFCKLHLLHYAEGVQDAENRPMEMKQK